MTKIESDSTKLWSLSLDLKHKFKFDKKSKEQLTNEEYLAQSIVHIADILQPFFSGNEMPINVLRFIVNAVLVLIVFSFVPIALFILYWTYNFISSLWSSSTPDTRFTAVWAIPMLIIGGLFGIFIDRKFRKKQ